MDAQVRVGTVHIVEWLRPGDRSTGWDLYNEIEPLGIVSNPQISVSFDRITTRMEFLSLLRRFEADLRSTGRVPLLHVETHGSDGGIGVSDAEGFAFADLMNALIPLNRLTGLRLFVVLSACEGIWGIKMLQPAERAAFLALVGPNRRISESELATAMQVFYRRLLTSRDGDGAIQAMNAAIDPDRPTFGAFNAELAFKSIYQEFWAQKCTPQALAQRAESIVAALQAQSRIERGHGLSRSELAKARALAHRHIGDHRRHFDRFRREFFFIDVCPENHERFGVTLEDCQGVQGSGAGA